MPNPLIDDRVLDFLLYEVHPCGPLFELPAFEGLDRESVELFVGGARRVARELLFPTYRAMDESPPRFVAGRIETHEALPAVHRALVELGCIAACRPNERGGAGLPQLVYTLASSYLMAGNLGAYGYAGLTAGAAHLLEAFGSPALCEQLREPMLEGRFIGTMALTEPHAGSSLGDIRTRARPAGDHYLIDGSKIFISGGDNSFSENVVHLMLARIEGAPAGAKGISLFAVPNRRLEDGRWVDNDVTVAGMIHKIGWKALPSLALELGDRGDCHGYLVGEPNQGLRMMFQMMNEARRMVGMNGAATASVAYHEARRYALERTQGRRGTSDGPMVPIVAHADVRRMLLRSKSIVDGALSLLAETALAADLAEHAASESVRADAALVCDVLTPIAKSFPAEFGYEVNVLAVQVHGGYGYSSEYLPEAFLRDQKLNSIHEGTTGIQALDLLGRKVSQAGGRGLQLVASRMRETAAQAREAGFSAEELEVFERAVDTLVAVPTSAREGGLAGADRLLGHATDYLTLASIVAVAWQHWKMRVALRARPAPTDAAARRFADGVEASARYFLAVELPRVPALAAVITGGDTAFHGLDPSVFED